MVVFKQLAGLPTSRAPAGVSPWKCCPRLISVTFSSRSSLTIAVESAGCETASVGRTAEMLFPMLRPRSIRAGESAWASHFSRDLQIVYSRQYVNAGDTGRNLIGALCAPGYGPRRLLCEHPANSFRPVGAQRARAQSGPGARRPLTHRPGPVSRICGDPSGSTRGAFAARCGQRHWNLSTKCLTKITCLSKVGGGRFADDQG